MSAIGATVRTADGGHQSRSRTIPDSVVRFDTASADVVIGSGSAVRQDDGLYYLSAELDGAEIDLTVRPAPNRISLPRISAGPNFGSGYVVPTLAATAHDRVCLPASAGSSARCEEVTGARATGRPERQLQGLFETCMYGAPEGIEGC